MIFQLQEYNICHINGQLGNDFPTAGVENISHKRLNQGMIFPPLVIIFRLLYDEIQS